MAGTHRSRVTPEIIDCVQALVDMQGQDPAEKALLGRVLFRGDEPPALAELSTGSRGVNRCFRYALTGGIQAYHKPFEGLNDMVAQFYGHNGPTGQVEAWQPVHEAAAWQLAKRLGAPWQQIVCPCVMRVLDGRPGSLSQASGLAVKGGEVAGSAEFRAAAFFDVLAGQQDRNHGNFFTDGSGSVSLYDHGFCFAQPGDYAGACVLAKPFAGEDINDDERAVLVALLDSTDWFGMLKVLSTTRALALADRARRMLNLGVILKPGDF